MLPEFHRRRLPLTSLRCRHSPQSLGWLFFSFLYFESHVCASGFFKFIQSRIMKFLKARQWVQHMRVLCSVNWPNAYRVLQAVRTRTFLSLSWQLCERNTGSPSRRNWALERVTFVLKVTKLVSGRAGNPVRFFFFTSVCLLFWLAHNRAGAHMHSHSQRESKVRKQMWMHVSDTGLLWAEL